MTRLPPPARVPSGTLAACCGGLSPLHGLCRFCYVRVRWSCGCGHFDQPIQLTLRSGEGIPQS